jgi:flavorubredoxin
MDTPFRAVKISENVYWVGAIDWELSDFHGYATPSGSTYNAFLILDEKVTLIDTVKAAYFDEMMSRVRSVIDPRKIDFIVSNHSEMDHTGALPRSVEAMNPEAVYASAKGVDAIGLHMSPGLDITAVSEGESISIGAGTLTFMMTSMVHWPDSMFAYYDRDQILFSNDAFGMHLASSERWADELPEQLVWDETATYYANILWPTSRAVQGVLKKVEQFDEGISLIAPDHGPLWRGDKQIDSVVKKYSEWAAGTPEKKHIVVLFDTMWGSTAKLARAVTEGAANAGVSVKVLPLAKTTRAQVATEVMLSSGVAIGSPNLNGGIFPSMADALTYLKGLRPNKPVIPGVIFGSYGWSPAVFKELTAYAEGIGIELVSDAAKVKYVPGDTELLDAYKLGEALGSAVLKPDAESGGE